MSSNRRNPVAVGRRSPISNSVGVKQSSHNAYSASFSGLKPMMMARDGQSSPESSRMNGLEKRSSSVGKDEVLKMNLMAIRKVDPSVLGIVSTVPQVVLYQYQSSSEEWERTSTEGTLFIYSRSSVPSHGFVILNRLNSENMQSVVTPRMEFRVQHPFVLFKGKSGEIYGLCFQEESICQETGDLLNSLSNQLSSDMRNSSAPVFEASHKPKPNFDVSELMDHKSYLGQTYSDGTSSPDSLTSEPISFIASTTATTTSSTKDNAHLHQSALRGQTTKQQSKGNSLPVKQKNVKGTGKNSLRSTSPKNIPGSKKMSKKDVSGSVSPMKQRSHLSQQKQLSHSYASGQELHRGRPLHHAASFDQGRGYPVNRENSPINSQQSPLKNGTSSKRNGGAKTQKVVTPKQQSFAVYETLVNQVWPAQDDQTKREHHQIESASKEHDNRIVKQLFGSQLQQQPAHVQPLSAITPPTTMSVTLQNIFSQADSSIVSYSGPHVGLSQSLGSSAAKKPLPLKAVSLDEIEKQIVAEAPSPEVVHPPVVLGTSTNVHSSQVGENILLQPSVFTSTVSTSGRSMESATSNGGSSIGRTKPSSNGDTVVALTVQPPTPVVAQSQEFPSSSLGSVLLHPEAFPSIPPVIHSPGMRAPPISSSAPKGGEPSSLATVRSHPVAASTHHHHHHHHHQNETSPGMPYRALSEPVISGMTTSVPSQQHNHTMEALLEVSIPHRSTTAPVSSALMSPQQFVQRESQAGVKQESLEVLTKEQLQQSLIYMIQHDDSFVDKLYQAYQKSVHERNT